MFYFLSGWHIALENEATTRYLQPHARAFFDGTLANATASSLWDGEEGTNVVCCHITTWRARKPGLRGSTRGLIYTTWGFKWIICNFYQQRARVGENKTDAAITPVVTFRRETCRSAVLPPRGSEWKWSMSAILASHNKIYHPDVAISQLVLLEAFRSHLQADLHLLGLR